MLQSVDGATTDDTELSGLDPFAILDHEADRLERFFAGLGADAWSRPSRCAGWTVRDVLGHLAAAEEYHAACCDGTVSALMDAYADRGAADVDAFNALGIADRAGLSSKKVLDEWKAANATTRRRFRELGDGAVDTSIGAYPCRWQAFHVAGELATHADDLGVPITEDERDERRGWRTRFSRFALAESKPDLRIEVDGDTTIVSDGKTTVELDEDDLIDGVAGRLDHTSGYEDAIRHMLTTMP
jgi:uncharacterized protein (TIGR03083 family)